MNSRRKGHDGEREIAAILRQALNMDIVRNLAQTRDGGHDIQVGVFGLEVKRAAVVTEAKVARWWQQAVDQADRAGLTPALAYRADRQPWAVRLPLVALRPDILGELTVDIGLDGFAAVVREVAEEPHPRARSGSVPDPAGEGR